MPKGPQGQKRPADAIGAAIRVARIATGEEAEDKPTSAAAELGRKGGKARAKSLTKEQREEMSRIAAAARWKKS